VLFFVDSKKKEKRMRIYLSNVESIVEVAKGVEFPLLAVDRDVELLDTLKGKLITLHKDANGGVHEALGDLERLGGHGSGEESDLRYM
jgi:hypothetical protein